MDKVIYVASNGAKQAMLAMQANNQNLANVNTTGFKADLLRFTSYPLEGGKLPTRTYTLATEGGSNVSVGPLTITNRPLDVAVKNSGWLTVQGTDGGEAYTRAGNLQVSPTGMLTTANGKIVIGNRGPIAIPPHQRLEIGADGTISILPIGQTDALLAVVDRLKLVDPPASELKKGPDGLFYGAEGNINVNGNVQVMSGALEGSNVSSVDAMMNMIELSRYYESQIKFMRTAQDNADKAESIIQF